MVRPLSMDLRERAVARIAAGESVRKVARALSVAPSSVVKWTQRLRATGSVAPGKIGGHVPPKIAGAHRAWLVARTAAAAFTLRGLVAELAGRGLRVDYRTVWTFIRREGLSFKKNRAGERAKPSRRRPQAQAVEDPPGRIDPRRLVFIDETWAKTNMGPLRGWAPRGQRLPGQVPYGHWKTMTFLAALRCDRID